MQTFEHGGKIFAAARELNVDISEIIDFSANINPFVTTEKLESWAKNAWRKIPHYPDVDYTSEREFFSAYHNVKPEQIVLGNGAASLISLIVRAIKPKTALITAPAFAEYSRALVQQKAAIESVAVRHDLSLDLDLFFQKAVDKEIAFLTTPNNPTGKLLDKKELIGHLQRAQDGSKTIFVLDEAFVDFTDEGEANSLTSELDDLSNLIVLRSLTKFYGIAGLRLGYMLTSNSEILNTVKSLQTIWNVNIMATEIAMAAMKDKEFYQRSRASIIELKQNFRTELLNIGIESYSSQANYFLIQTNSQKMYSELYKMGILIRNCDNFDGLDGNYYRLAVKSKEQNQRLLSALKKIYRGLND